MTPIVNEQHLWFEAGGLYDGLVLLRDLQTKSYWNHITGECLYGDYAGHQLEINNLYHYTIEAALIEFPDLKIAVSKLAFPMNIFSKISTKLLMKKKGFIPPIFRKTMSKGDTRLEEHVIGLGIVINNKAKFYPVDDIISEKTIRDVFQDLNLEITFDEASRTPRCKIKNEDTIPMQLYTRWYGFSYTYKGCQIYKNRAF